jgi:hypothetical protein
MLDVRLNDSQMRQAYNNEKNLPSKMKYSVSGDLWENRFAGCIGELACALHLDTELQHDFEYDILHNGKRIDVKTMRRTVKPAADYACRVTIHGHMQDCDIYVFASVVHRNEKFEMGATLCGWATKDEVEKWTRVYKDQPWPECPSKTERSDAYKSTYANLRPMNTL